MKAKKTTAKKTAAKKPERFKIKELEGTGADVAYLIGVTSANITQLEQTNTIHRLDNGMFNLVDSVSSYCRALRDRKQGNSKTDLELENLALKNEKLKEALRSWRMQRDREVAMAILEAQRNAMQRLREECKLVPALVQVIDGMMECINSVDVEQISYIVEGENEEEDE